MVLTWSDWLKLFNLSLGPKEFQVSQRTIYPALTVLSDFTSLGRTTRCNFKAPWVSTGRNQPITHTCRDTRNYIFISVTGRIWTILTPTRCMWKSMYDHVLDLFQLLSYLPNLHVTYIRDHDFTFLSPTTRNNSFSVGYIEISIITIISRSIIIQIHRRSSLPEGLPFFFK